jgi:hypothetical protein
MADDEKLYTDIVDSIKEVGQLFDQILKTQDMNEKKRKYTLINEKVKLILMSIKDIKENKKNLYSKYKGFKLIDKTISNYIKEKREKKAGYLEAFRIEISELPRKIKIEEAKTKLNESRTESFMQAYNRSLVFLYYKMKQIPIPEKKYQLESNEKKELLNAIHSFKEKGDHEKMSLELFHTSKDDFDKELIRYEKDVGILNYNTDYARRTYEVGRSFSGLMSLLGKSERQLQYIADYSDHICNEKDINKYCISIVNNIDSYDALPDEGKTKEYILVKKEFFPESSTLPILINYKRLPLISFLLDAFFNDGVIKITPELEEKLRNDYPELYYGPHPENYIQTLKKSVNNAISLHTKTKTNVTRRAMNKAKNNLKKLMNIVIPLENKGKNKLKLNSPTNSLNNSLRILNTDRPELRIRKRIGTIRKKVTTVKSLATALKTRRSRK